MLRASAFLGEAVAVPPVNYTPQEREAIERAHAEALQKESPPDAFDAIEAVVWIVRVIVGLLT